MSERAAAEFPVFFFRFPQVEVGFQFKYLVIMGNGKNEVLRLLRVVSMGKGKRRNCFFRVSELEESPRKIKIKLSVCPFDFSYLSTTFFHSN